MGIKVSDIKQCFYEPGKPGIIDAIHPATGLGLYSKETLEQVRERNPGAEIGDFEEVAAEQDSYWRRAPIKIDAERFEEMLGVLPPENWISERNSESFKLMEYTSGLVTAIFCRIGHDYYEMQDRASMPHAEIIKACRAL